MMRLLNSILVQSFSFRAITFQTDWFIIFLTCVLFVFSIGSWGGRRPPEPLQISRRLTTFQISEGEGVASPWQLPLPPWTSLKDMFPNNCCCFAGCVLVCTKTQHRKIVDTETKQQTNDRFFDWIAGLFVFWPYGSWTFLLSDRNSMPSSRRQLFLPASRIFENL